MIKRADFAQQAEAPAIELGEKLIIEQISSKSPFLRFLRKPDFQRETNHWSPEQVSTLVRSFAFGELIPSLILWKSAAYVFVIDGAHRLSALKAWVENDYGDGTDFSSFFWAATSLLNKNGTLTQLESLSRGRLAAFQTLSPCQETIWRQILPLQKLQQIYSPVLYIFNGSKAHKK